MPRYVTNFTYSNGSWARLVNTPGDRTVAVQRVLEALGGSLNCLYWLLGTHDDGVLVVDLPDSVSVEAWETVVRKTGAFNSVETHELLTQQQLQHTLVLARDAAQAYEVPGQVD
jgi:uncharacterized protein with GYD domain